jgi:phosphopentomutase
MDSAGVGALPDAQAYGDATTVNTIANTAEYVGGLRLPNFEAIGLGALVPVRDVGTTPLRPARIARLAEQSAGKDTITGHWEMAGIITEIAFPTFPHGFPAEVVSQFAGITGRAPLGNIPASGTEIIAELGEEHMRTGRPILYTSADSVFQVAAHEDIVPIEMLHYWCEEARKMLVPPYEVNRVIARPFVGQPGAFVRTANRHDYAVIPPENILDRLSAANIPVHAVGKIHDIYSGRGIVSSRRVADNEETMTATLELMNTVEAGLIFSNFNDFDTKYGHRRDARGYAGALERFDARLPEIFASLRSDDVVIITADHGCDPTAPGTDHTREYVPYLSFGAVEPANLGIINGLTAVGETVTATLLPSA